MSEKDEEIKQLRKQLELERAKLRHIYNIGHRSIDILGSQKPEKLSSVLEVIIDEATEILDSEIASILIFDPESDKMSIHAAKGLDQDVIEETEIKIGEKISGWVAQNKKAILVHDIEKDPRFAKRNHERYYTKSLISAPIMIDHTVLGVININNKRNRQPYNQEDLELLQTVADHTALVISNVNLYNELQLLYINIVETLTETVDLRDHYTKSHSEHVSKYAVAIAKEMGLSKNKIEIVARAAKLHDIGKIGVHDYILTKPGKLTAEEWETMKTHALKGAEILEPLGFLNGVIETVRQHHERYDGKGYPYKKQANEICIEAKILAVADAFDAMTTERPYAKALTKEQATEELKKESGKQFDPKVVDAFLRILERED